MFRQEYEAEIAAFIRAKGVTRRPTAFAVPTHGSNNPSDRVALRQCAEHLEPSDRSGIGEHGRPVVVAASKCDR
jgi:hypothetical protein